MKYSLILTGRDDRYGGDDFINRTFLSVSSNIDALTELNVPYEYILAEWSPLNGKYFHKNPVMKRLYEFPTVRGLILEPSLVTADGLDPNDFHEYFAKNAAMRRVKGDFIIMLNADIIIPKELFEEIDAFANTGDTDKLFGRVRFRGQIQRTGQDNYSELPEDMKDLYEPDHPFGDLVTGYAGDFLFIKTETMQKYDCCYDELNPLHRTSARQSGMDGELLINMKRKGLQPAIFQTPYYHINHGKFFPLDGCYNTQGYESKPNWGYVGCKERQENNLTFLYA